MAKGLTRSLAKPKPKPTPPLKATENVSSAIDALKVSSNAIDKSAGIIERRLEALEEYIRTVNEDWATKYEGAVTERDVEIAELKKDLEAALAKWAAIDEKLRKVQAGLV